MPWIAAGAAVIGFLGSRSARKEQRRAQQQQTAIAQQQLAMGQRQMDMGQRTYDDWYNTFFPVAGEAISEARRDVRPDFERIAGDVRGQFQGQRGAMVRDAQRYGINPQDGVWSANMARLGGEEAKTHVLARNRARQDAQGKKLSNLMNVYGMGANMPGVAAGFMSGANAPMNAASATYGNTANAAGQDAANTAYGISNIVSSIPWGNFVRSGSSGGTANSVPGQGGTGYSVPNYGAQSGPWSSGYSYPSSRELKYGIQNVAPDEALDTVMRTPVKGYKYKGSTEPFIGTIAEEAPREISDGKRVNLVNQVGTLTGAVQALAGRLNRSPNMAKPIRYGMPGKRDLSKPIRDSAENVSFDDAPSRGNARFIARRRYGIEAMA